MFDRGPSPHGVVVGVGSAARLRQASGQGRQKANTRWGRQQWKYLSLVLEQPILSPLASSKRISSAPHLPFPTPVPLPFVTITASPRERWFLLCQRFLPPLSLCSQDVSFRKHELIPPRLTLVCFHSASSASKLFPSPYVGATENKKGKKVWRSTIYSFECFSSLLPTLSFRMKSMVVVFFFPPGVRKGDLFLKVMFFIGVERVVPRRLYKSRICCSKLPGEFARDWLRGRTFIFWCYWPR